MNISSWVAAMLVATVAACGADQHRPDHDTDLQRDADAIRDLGVTGVQARMISENGEHLVVTSGVADITGDEPVDPDGYFRIGSDTKPFVATVVLQLVGEGRLALEDTVEQHLPGVVAGNANDGSLITVRHLLQHTSGIHDDYPGFDTPEQFVEKRFDPYSPEELVARAMTHPPDFAPGTAWAYSNTGYLLLAMIIERVTGHPWYEEVDGRIAQRLGLQHTVFPGDAAGLPEPHAHGYQRFVPGGKRVDVTELIDWNASGGLISTTADLNRFFRALLDGTLLGPAELAEMQRTVPVDEQVQQLWPDGRYGLGLRMRPLPCGGAYWGHGGGGSGYMTEDGITSDGRRSVVVSMSSTLSDSFESILRQQHAADALVERALCA
jgi:D-alanyl-D-alanine carboxypeptidase